MARGYPERDRSGTANQTPMPIKSTSGRFAGRFRGGARFPSLMFRPHQGGMFPFMGRRRPNAGGVLARRFQGAFCLRPYRALPGPAGSCHRGCGHVAMWRYRADGRPGPRVNSRAGLGRIKGASSTTAAAQKCEVSPGAILHIP